MTENLFKVALNPNQSNKQNLVFFCRILFDDNYAYGLGHNEHDEHNEEIEDVIEPLQVLFIDVVHVLKTKLA